MADDKGRHQNLPVSSRNNHNLQLVGDELLVKWSEYNTVKAKKLVEFEKEFPNCIFARVVRVGPTIIDPENLTSGKVVVLKKGVGVKLEAMTLIERCDHFIVRESDVLYYGSLD